MISCYSAITKAQPRKHETWKTRKMRGTVVFLRIFLAFFALSSFRAFVIRLCFSQYSTIPSFHYSLPIIPASLVSTHYVSVEYGSFVKPAQKTRGAFRYSNVTETAINMKGVQKVLEGRAHKQPPDDKRGAREQIQMSKRINHENTK
jgi:hypothetical protein